MNKPHWPAHNLKELESFLQLQHPGGIRLSVAAAKLGVSAQAVSATMRKDDASLSWIENLALKFGYNLRLEYTLPVYTGYNKGLKASELYPNAGNLMGLAEYATTRGLTINAFANRLGINYRVVENALKHGNIKMSTLNAILSSLEIHVKWVWEEIATM